MGDVYPSTLWLGELTAPNSAQSTELRRASIVAWGNASPDLRKKSNPASRCWNVVFILGSACRTFCAAYNISRGCVIARGRVTGITSFPMPSAGMRPTRRGDWEVPRLDWRVVA